MPKVHRLAVLTSLLLCVATLLACTDRAGASFDARAAWADGEQSVYDVTGRDDAVIGRDTLTWSKRDGHWVLLDERAGGRAGRGEVVLDDRLRPLSMFKERGTDRVEATYGPDRVEVRSRGADGKTSEKEFPRPPEGLDNEQVLMTQRGLPFATGYAARYDNVSVKAGMSIPATVRVEGEETVTVPAGTFAAWRVTMAVAGSEHHAWYAKDAPHLLVRYENPQAGAMFVLRSWRVSEGAPVRGSLETPPLRPPGSVPVSWLRVAITAFLQIPLMSLLPLVLGYVFAKKLRVSWKIWLVGALTFVASQVVHLPLNWAMGLLGAPRGAALLPLPWLALVAGLSAGMCEEVARYVALRFALRKIAHSWEEAVQFGAGHGGIEAMIVGALSAISVGAMMVIHWSPSTFGLEGDVLAQTLEAADQFWLTPAHMAIVGGVERVFAMTAHIGMTVLVMRAVSRRNIAYLVAAIAAHTVLDMYAVWAMARLGIWWIEAGVAVFALAMLALTLGMRGRAEVATPESVVAP